MKTDDLIAAMAADLPTRTTPVSRAVMIALGLSLPVTLAILAFAVHVRPGLLGMLFEPRILFKFVFTLSLLAAAYWLTMRITRPGIDAGPARLALAGVFALLLGAVAIELTTLPAGAWGRAMIGTYALPCVVLITVFSAAPLAALLYALKSGAPDSPALAGAAAGLVAGSIGAAVYATHCIEDSPLFLALWYTIGISAVTLLGAAIGRHTLKW
jgi:hypothetical protein